MTMTVILAEDRLEAIDAAQNLGIQRRNWLYPVSARDLQGVVVGRVVYVSGWHRSQRLHADVLELLTTRMTPDTAEVEQPSNAEWMATLLAAVRELPTPTVPPFMDLAAPVPAPRRSWWRRLFSRR